MRYKCRSYIWLDDDSDVGANDPPANVADTAVACPSSPMELIEAAGTLAYFVASDATTRLTLFANDAPLETPVVTAFVADDVTFV